MAPIDMYDIPDSDSFMNSPNENSNGVVAVLLLACMAGVGWFVWTVTSGRSPAWLIKVMDKIEGKPTDKLNVAGRPKGLYNADSGPLRSDYLGNRIAADSQVENQILMGSELSDNDIRHRLSELNWVGTTGQAHEAEAVRSILHRRSGGKRN